MRRHPVHDHADISLVEIIDQIAKDVGSAVPRGGSIVIADLVAPRWSIRMFLQRQKLDMRETRFQNMFGNCRGHFWNEDLPNTGIAERPHRMPRAVPVVEVADDAYPFRVWSPDGKRNSFYAFMRDHVRAELLVNLLVPTFAKEIEIKFPQRRRK